MASGHLVFRKLLPASGHLVFRPVAPDVITGYAGGSLPGLSGGAIGSYRERGIAGGSLPGLSGGAVGLYILAQGAAGGTLPGLSGGAVGVVADVAGMAGGALPGLSGGGDGEFAPRIWRGLSASVGCRFARGERVLASLGVPILAASPQAAGWSISWASAQGLAASITLPLVATDRIAQSTAVVLGKANKLDASSTVAWSQTERATQSAQAAWGRAARLEVSAQAQWAACDQLWQQSAFRWRAGIPSQTALVVSYRLANQLRRSWDIPWRPGHPPPYRTPAPVPPVVPPRPDYEPDAHLVFRERLPTSLHLVFRRGVPRRVLPTREFYSVHNTAYCKRVADDLAIECKSIRISGGWQSWGRRISIEAFYTEREKLDVSNGPIEIEIGANGVVWRALVKSPRLSRKFNADTVGFEAVSLTAMVAAPNAEARTWANASPATAQQIALTALVGTGMSLDWQIVDPVIPAGVFSLPQATPMAVVQRLAAAYGGYVQSDRSAKIIAVKKQYPTMPWHWPSSVPDVELPEDVFESLGSELVLNPAYDGAYVSGQGYGFNALVVPDGSSGLNLAPMVVDPLLTDLDAIRARGEAVLGGVGPRSKRTIALGVYPEIGVVEPGQLVRVSGEAGWTDIVRSTDIDIAWRQQGLEIWQTLGLGDAADNDFVALQKLLVPSDPLLVGAVATHHSDGTSTVVLPGGGTIRVRGTSVASGLKAFVQGGEVRGEAPDLDTVTVVLY